jgi:2-amino-4-hydroxy-6-hydroxymethyldihydropteridine diphosphokinase
MPRVWVSAGSNIDRERSIRAALWELKQAFGELVVSPVYETEAVGFDGDAFFNLVVGFDTDLAPRELHSLLREVESRHGRQRGGEKFSSRTLDLDVLTYGDAVTDEGGKPLPRDEILKYAFVLKPLADVAPGERHPETGESYEALWERFPALAKAGLHRLDAPVWLEGWMDGPASPPAA